ncbi:extracellular solute-binding protein [Cohnella thailandensis]|uniref:Extracellular solute-binding protein n=1 Tax=Cohnella thailandensis TaxID=557557 RepID=A0A841SQ73_9BACL|nr:extracellular solute-binding protein [Cohnella thailandensis]MBB6634563.1 extracellular solute-binding protein [Cohnella thailandensis]MBP1972882.1 putative aldouronate transport system substrate-binding protein [Cohnella thailandensis]
MIQSKRTAIGLAFALVATALTACSNANGSTVADNGTGGRGAVTIQVMTVTHQLTKDLQDIPYLTQIARDANVNVEWTQLRTGWEERKSVVLTSGDLPDAFLAGLTDQDIIANKDHFVDLSEYIDKYAPNIKKMFAERPDTKRISMFPDGKIYSLPAVRPIRPNSLNVMMINKKWLDKLGLRKPTTLEELRDVLIAFRDKDPNGNGKPDEIGLDWWAGAGGGMGSRGLFSVTSLLGAYGISDHFTEEMIGVRNGNIRFLFAGEEYKKLVEYLAGLWQEKLINPEVFTQDYTGMKAKAQQDDVATVGVTFGWSLTDRVDQWASEYEPLAPLKSSDDIKPVWPTSPDRVQLLTNLFTMTKSNAHPIETMKWINSFYSEDNSIQGYYGSMPEFIAKREDGRYEITPAPDGDQDTQQWTNALVDDGPLYASDELESKTIQPPSVIARQELDDVYRDYAPADPRDIYPIVKFSAEQIDEMSLAKRDILKLVDQKFAEWIVKSNADSQWDDYLKQLDQMGLPLLKRMYQQAYDDYYKH